jgi:ADP-ribose pyrophosphatase YjhB (NUDIX family)
MRAQVVLLDGNRILLARHERGDHRYWVLPGGAVEPNEDPKDAAIREVREETGLEIRLERLLFVDGPRKDGPVNIRNPRHTYLGSITGGEMRSVSEPGGGNERNGHLAGVEWMRFESAEFDGATRDTLGRVRWALSDR